MEINKIRFIPSAVAVAMLFWAFYPGNPYAYYSLLRVMVFSACVLEVWFAVKMNRPVVGWMMGLTAVLYNPFATIHLNRGLWTLINAATIALFAINGVVLFREARKRIITSSVKD
jgi:hypothetical protein